MPITVLAFAVLVPVNWTSGTLENDKSLNYDEIDKLSISNLGKGSKRYFCFLHLYDVPVLAAPAWIICCFFEELCVACYDLWRELVVTYFCNQQRHLAVEY